MTLSDNIRKREERKKQESDKFHKLVGENLRRLRLKHNYTQEYLAELIGKKNYSSYGRIETGDVRLGIEEAIVLSRLYDTSIERLLNPPETEDPAVHDAGETYPAKRNVVEITVKLDGTEVSLIRQVDILQSINKVLSDSYASA